MDEKDQSLLSLLQNGLPLTEKPFQVLGQKLRLTEEQVLERIRQLTHQGFIRKFGAFLNHRKAGFFGNGMVVWDVPEELLVEIGTELAKRPTVSHCYARSKSEAWPFRLYTMIHGKDRTEVEKEAQEIAVTFSLSTYRILFSTKEFKKSGQWLQPKE